jgi:hypothetical protein
MKAFIRILLGSLYVMAVTLVCILVFDMNFDQTLIVTLLVVYCTASLLIGKNIDAKHTPKKKRSPHPIIRMLETDDEVYED